MKQVLFLMLLIFYSCTKQETKVSVILDNENINVEAIKSLDESENALLTWYLYAYGNACDTNSSKLKCEILKELNISDECDPDHLNNLLQWFSTDMLAVYKLNDCPNIQSNSAIQNAFHKIIIVKQNDTVSIDYLVKGMNNSEEKSWNFESLDKYLLEGKTLVKIKPNE